MQPEARANAAQENRGFGPHGQTAQMKLVEGVDSSRAGAADKQPVRIIQPFQSSSGPSSYPRRIQTARARGALVHQPVKQDPKQSVFSSQPRARMLSSARTRRLRLKQAMKLAQKGNRGAWVSTTDPSRRSPPMLAFSALHGFAGGRGRRTRFVKGDPTLEGVEGPLSGDLRRANPLGAMASTLLRALKNRAARAMKLQKA